MTNREATQHPNLKALGTTLFIIVGPAAVIGLGFLVATYAPVIAGIVGAGLIFTAIFLYIREHQNRDVDSLPSMLPISVLFAAGVCVFFGTIISQA
jgi:hypothetical protein